MAPFRGVLRLQTDLSCTSTTGNDVPLVNSHTVQTPSQVAAVDQFGYQRFTTRSQTNFLNSVYYTTGSSPNIECVNSFTQFVPGVVVNNVANDSHGDFSTVQAALLNRFGNDTYHYRYAPNTVRVECNNPNPRVVHVEVVQLCTRRQCLNTSDPVTYALASYVGFNSVKPPSGYVNRFSRYQIGNSYLKAPTLSDFWSVTSMRRVSLDPGRSVVLSFSQPSAIVKPFVLSKATVLPNDATEPMFTGVSYRYLIRFYVDPVGIGSTTTTGVIVNGGGGLRTVVHYIETLSMLPPSRAIAAPLADQSLDPATVNMGGFATGAGTETSAFLYGNNNETTAAGIS